MYEKELQAFLKKGGRSQSAIKRVLSFVRAFEGYLDVNRGGIGLDEAEGEDLLAFVDWVETESKKSAKLHLWAIRYYYEYTSNEEMRQIAGALREQRIERQPFALKDFRGVNDEYVEKLSEVGIKNVAQMLDAGRTPGDRQKLSKQTGVPMEAILEFVKLSDLARIPGVKGIRARLYHDAGVDTVEKMASWAPEDLRTMIVEFVERTGFEGVATLPAEARFTVAIARKLPKVVDY